MGKGVALDNTNNADHKTRQNYPMFLAHFIKWFNSKNYMGSELLYNVL